ncbi:MAG: TolC family protein [Parachlamydiaceae bacterium]|nr:TolC family protein [Parachlamydiaceae bacterium]
MKKGKGDLRSFVSFLVLCSLGSCIPYRPLPLDSAEEFQNVQARSWSKKVVIDRCNHSQDYYFPIAEKICLQNGLALDEANSLALFYSPEILKARSELNIRAAILLEAGAPNNPEVFLGPRISTRDAGLIFPGGILFEILFSNWRISQRAAAIWERERDLWLLLDKEIEILASIQKKFLQIEADRKREKIARKQVFRSKEIMLWVNSHYSSGEMDLLSFQISLRGLEDAKVELMNSILLRKKSERDLLKIVGLLPDSKIKILFGHLPLLDLNVEGLEISQILMHPALKAIEVEYLAAEQNLRVEIAKQLPALKLGPDFEYDRGDFSLGIGLEFDLPIFTQNKTPIAVAEEKRRRIRINYDEKLLDFSEKLANLKDEFQLLNEREKELRPTLADSKFLDGIFFDSFQSNKEGVLQALAASNSIGNTLLEEVDLERRIGQAKIDLLLISASLLPSECVTYVKEQGQ